MGVILKLACMTGIPQIFSNFQYPPTRANGIVKLKLIYIYIK